jgi:hypothetical protein
MASSESAGPVLLPNASRTVRTASRARSRGSMRSLAFAVTLPSRASTSRRRSGPRTPAPRWGAGLPTYCRNAGRLVRGSTTMKPLFISGASSRSIRRTRSRSAVVCTSRNHRARCQSLRKSKRVAHYCVERWRTEPVARHVVEIAARPRARDGLPVTKGRLDGERLQDARPRIGPSAVPGRPNGNPLTHALRRNFSRRKAG